MTIYNYYTIRELAPQQHECTPDMHFGYNAGRVKNRIYLPDTFIGATYYFDGEYSNRYGTSQIDDEGHPYIDINFNDGEIGNGTVFIIAGKRYCTFQYTLEYVNVHETEIDASEIDTSNLVTKQTFDNTVERIDNDITTGDTANRTAIDQLTAATNQRFADVNTKLSGYDEEIGAVDTEVKNLASEVDGYTADIAKAVADAADAKSIAEGAADDAATADAAAKEAQDSVAALDTRVGAVENSVETAETTANEAKNAAQTAQTTAGEAQTAASGAKTRADEAYTLAETAQSDAEGATTKATTAQSTADGVKKRVDTIEETTIPGISNRVEALQAGEETLSKSIELLSGSVDTVQENYNTLNDSVGNLGTAVQANIQDISSLETKVAEVETTANDALPKTGGEIVGTLKIKKGVVVEELGYISDTSDTAWNSIKSWYASLSAQSVGFARIHNNQPPYHGLPGGAVFFTAYKTNDLFGVIVAVGYAPLFGACVINDGNFPDFSASITAHASYIPTQAQSAAVVSRMMLAQMPDLTDDDKLRVSGLYDTWAAGSHAEGDICNAENQTWECFQAHDNATYPDIKPGSAAWFTFWRPLHGKSPETARPFVPVQGAHDMYRAREYMVWTDGSIKRATQDTAYSPEDYSPAWEDIT